MKLGIVTITLHHADKKFELVLIFAIGGLIFPKSLTFHGSGFAPLKVNNIPQIFISGLPKIDFSGLN